MRYGPVQPISPGHVTSAFDCGSPAQADWLRRHALRAHRSDTSHVRVATLVDQPVVVGYHALAAGSVAPAEAPGRVLKGVGRHAVPVILLTRLGVDVSEQGRGLGRLLLRDAILGVAAAAGVIGARALLIHCEDEDARAFYLHQAEFEPSPTDPLHLFLVLGDLRRTLGR